MLDAMIKNRTLRGPTAFWLNGHWSMDDTALSREAETPILQELESVLLHFNIEKIIFIDDAFMFGGFESPSRVDQPPATANCW